MIKQLSPKKEKKNLKRNLLVLFYFFEEQFREEIHTIKERMYSTKEINQNRKKKRLKDIKRMKKYLHYQLSITTTPNSVK